MLERFRRTKDSFLRTEFPKVWIKQLDKELEVMKSMPQEDFLKVYSEAKRKVEEVENPSKDRPTDWERWLVVREVNLFLRSE